MRILAIVFFFSCFITRTYSQPGSSSCTPNVNIRAAVCPARDTICRPCYHCGLALQAENNDLVIESYRIIVYGPSFGEDIREFEVKGALLSGYAKNLVGKLQTGDTIHFECIKARGKNGAQYILKPFSHTLRNP
jgi:hypothetical protein